MIALNNLSIGFDKEIVANINTEISNGKLVCLIGKNGCGKTTLLKTIAKLTTPLSGEISIDNKPLKQLSNNDIAKQLSILLTERVSIRNITVEQMVAFGRYPYGGQISASDRQKITHALSCVHMENMRNNLFDKISEGEKQRTLIAKTLAQDTQNILLDEPTSYLDLPSKVQTLSIFKQLARKKGKCILMSIHEPELALKIADEIWLMSNGKIICDTPQSIVCSTEFQGDFLCSGISFNHEKMTFETKFLYS